MTLLSRRALFAIATVVDVALHARPTPVSAKAVAARHELGPRHLESVLNALVRAGLLKGIRGPRGGYELARERRKITVGEIVRAAERGGGEPEAVSDLISLVIAPAIEEAAEAFLKGLDAISIEQLCVRAEKEGQAEPGLRGPDFTI